MSKDYIEHEYAKQSGVECIGVEGGGKPDRSTELAVKRTIVICGNQYEVRTWADKGW